MVYAHIWKHLCVSLLHKTLEKLSGMSPRSPDALLAIQRTHEMKLAGPQASLSSIFNLWSASVMRRQMWDFSGPSTAGNGGGQSTPSKFCLVFPSRGEHALILWGAQSQHQSPLIWKWGEERAGKHGKESKGGAKVSEDTPLICQHHIPYFTWLGKELTTTLNSSFACSHKPEGHPTCPWQGDKYTPCPQAFKHPQAPGLCPHLILPFCNSLEIGH